MELTLKACHGTEITDAEIESGITAALAVFDSAGVDFEQCYQEQLEASTCADNLSATIWCNAENAAVKAACADWHRLPEDIILVAE